MRQIGPNDGDMQKALDKLRKQDTGELSLEKIKEKLAEKVQRRNTLNVPLTEESKTITPQQEVDFKKVTKQAKLGTKPISPQALKQRGFKETKKSSEFMNMLGDYATLFGKTYANGNGETITIKENELGKEVRYWDQKKGVGESVKYDSKGNFIEGEITVCDNLSRTSHHYTYELDAKGNKKITGHYTQPIHMMPSVRLKG